MTQLGSSRPPKFNASNHANCRAGIELLSLCLALIAVVGISGCKSSAQTPPASAKVAEPEHTETTQLTVAIADLRTQNAQLRQALEAALDAQEQLTNQVRQISEELHSARDDLSSVRDQLRGARDDLTLVRAELHDLELERETKPVGPSSGTMTAQKPQ